MKAGVKPMDNDKLLGAFFAAAAILIAVGAGLYQVQIGLIVGGVLTAVWAWLMFADDDPTPPVAVSPLDGEDE